MHHSFQDTCKDCIHKGFLDINSWVHKDNLVCSKCHKVNWEQMVSLIFCIQQSWRFSNLFLDIHLMLFYSQFQKYRIHSFLLQQSQTLLRKVFSKLFVWLCQSIINFSFQVHPLLCTYLFLKYHRDVVNKKLVLPIVTKFHTHFLAFRVIFVKYMMVKWTF